MQLGDAGLRLIAEFEGFRSHPYLDVVGIPTIGYGNTYYPDTGRRVTLADAPVTEREAADMLLATLARYVDGIDRYAQVPLTQNQFDALVSWAYNVGLEGARTSTLMRKLNEGDYVGAADQLMRWNKAGGREVPGLTRRRAAERALFLTECEAPA